MPQVSEVIFPLVSVDRYLGYTGKQQDGLYTFLGWTASILSYSSADGQWTLTRSRGNEAVATTNKTSGDYPLGKHMWTVENEQCYPSSVMEIPLKIWYGQDSRTVT